MKAENRGRRGGAAVPTVGLAAVVLIAAGAAVGIALPQSAASTPSELTSGGAIDVVTQSFDDARTVAVATTVTEPTSLVVSDTGTVTSSSCSPGAVIASGTSPIAVNGNPVVALATSAPLWKDLAPGDKGADVRSLQEELARLGYAVKVTGSYGSATRVALAKLFESVGWPKQGGALPLARVMWLPAAAVTIEKCGMPVGTRTGTDPYATTSGELVGLHLSGDVSDAVPGARVIRLGGVSGPIGPDGTVTDPALLEQFAASPEYKVWRAQDDAATPLMVSYALAEPVEVAVVPPAALYSLADSAGCVAVDGEGRSVTVLASSLGQTMVTFDGPAPSHVDLPAAGAEGAPCR